MGGGGAWVVLEGKKEEMRVLNQLIPKRPSEQQTKVLTNEMSSRCSCPKVKSANSQCDRSVRQTRSPQTSDQWQPRERQTQGGGEEEGHVSASVC